MSTETLRSLPLHRVTLHGETMGTRYSCVFHAPLPDGREALGRAVHAAVTDVDTVMSNWKPGSAICQLNEAPVGIWITLPDSLLHVLEVAVAVEAASGGAFDIGIGQDLARWGFGPRAASKLEVAGTAPRPSTRGNLEIDSANGCLRKHAPLALDLGGIAKGYGVDRLGETLSAMGVSDWLVGIDGEMRAKGTKPDGAAWAVGHERPVPGRREIAGVIELTDLAVATSGTYRQWHKRAGRIVSHTVDPARGEPVAGALASVTVLAQTCMMADAWATAILVDGHWPPQRFVPPPDIEVIALPPEGE